ncbi:MAG: phosphomethylpyrimidine synthase ThiC [Deltaproteobacteria bacterium]|nr:phosphomethylpyrimidine synthase ThiC [Deltaproteobacteria bacterium]
MSRRAYALERTGNRSQMHLARQGEITPEMQVVAESERLGPETIRAEVARGRMVIPANVHHQNLVPVGIGLAARCKVNANIGNSALTSDIENELHKLAVCVRYGADTVMDLSTGGDIPGIRSAILQNCPVPLGTVPVYEAVARAERVEDLSPTDLLEVVESQARQGVDYMTIHCGILRSLLGRLDGRLTGVVSRGGALMARWMIARGEENPFYQVYDDLLDLCTRYDITLSLGDSLRPGCLADAGDGAQYGELDVLGELCRRAWARDVQVMIEGPGHVPMHRIQENVEREQRICEEAPFYVLGPLVTDIAAGYDHIASAIGGALAAWAGASMLCYVTPKEHLALPDAEDVRAGIIAHRIAAHAADVARGRPGARDRDDEMARARFAFDWDAQFDLALDSDRAREYREAVAPRGTNRSVHHCSMCGPRFCAMRLSQDAATWRMLAASALDPDAPCLERKE